MKINVNTPCSENWNEMQANNDGRFCLSCQKTVVDFTQMTDVEIIAFFEQHKGQKICARMRKNQTNRDLEVVAATATPTVAVSRRTTALKAVLTVMALSTWIGSCFPSANAAILTNPVNMEQAPAVDPIKDSLFISGTVINGDSKKPIKAAGIMLETASGKILGMTNTDEKGAFSFDANLIKGISEPIFIHASYTSDYSRAKHPLPKENPAALPITIALFYEWMGDIGTSH